MTRRPKPLEIDVVRVQLARVVPMLRALLVIIENLALDLDVDVGAVRMADVPSLAERTAVQPQAPAGAKVTRVQVQAAQVQRAIELIGKRDSEMVGTAGLSPLPASMTTTPMAAAMAGRKHSGAITVLRAIAQRRTGATRAQIRLMTGYRPRTLETYLPRLHADGFVTSEQHVGESTRREVVTAAGLRELGADFKRLPEGKALRDHWLANLPEGERRIFALLIAHYPESISRAEIMNATGFAGRTLETYLPRLRQRELVHTDRGTVVASHELFEGTKKGER